MQSGNYLEKTNFCHSNACSVLLKSAGELLQFLSAHGAFMRIVFELKYAEETTKQEKLLSPKGAIVFPSTTEIRKPVNPEINTIN